MKKSFLFQNNISYKSTFKKINICSASDIQIKQLFLKFDVLHVYTNSE